MQAEKYTHVAWTTAVINSKGRSSIYTKHTVVSAMYVFQDTFGIGSWQVPVRS